MSENGAVPVGDVAVTSAGNLSAKYIIHTVGPRWGEGDEDEKLRRAIDNALRKADELGCKSISIPAISTGIFGFPKMRGAEIIVQTAKEFAKSPSTIKIIRFCNIDVETAKIFQSCLTGTQPESKRGKKN